MRKANGNATKRKTRLVSAKEPENTMFFEEDITLLYNALRSYKPAEEELVRQSIWLEGFAQVLVCDFDEDLEIPY
jgi:propanediol dehydratase small subunit